MFAADLVDQREQLPGLLAGDGFAGPSGLAVIVIGHAVENGHRLVTLSRPGLATAASLAVSLGAATDAAYLRGLAGVEGVAHGQSIVSFTETRFAVAGAGQGGAHTKLTRFKLTWHGLDAVNRKGSSR